MNALPSRFGTRVAMIAALALLGCGDTDASSPAIDPAQPEPEPPPLEPRRRADSDGDGRLDYLELINGTDPFKSDKACVEASYSVRPGASSGSADFVFVVDSSGSMYEELPQLRQGILDYFTPLLLSDALDFTVTVLADADALGTGFCLPASSEDRSCENSTWPPFNERFLIYDHVVDSTNSLSLLVETIHEPDVHGHAPRGWGARLRRKATPIFVVLTDDDSSLSQEEFEAALRAEDGDRRLYEDGGARRFIWHGIVGVAPPLSGLFYEADQEIQSLTCASAPRAGIVYQQLCRATGGLRIPVCEAVNYAALIERLAAPVVDGAVIPCTLSIPTPALSQAFTNTNQLGVQLRLGPRKPELLERVGGLSHCRDRGFYFERLSSAQHTLNLCPSLCEVVRREEDAELFITASCLDRSCNDSFTHGACR